MTTMTTEQAADLLGVSVRTVKRLVVAGSLEPVRRGARPLLFRVLDVERLRSDRRGEAWHAAMDKLATRWERECLAAGL